MNVSQGHPLHRQAALSHISRHPAGLPVRAFTPYVQRLTASPSAACPLTAAAAQVDPCGRSGQSPRHTPGREAAGLRSRNLRDHQVFTVCLCMYCVPVLPVLPVWRACAVCLYCVPVHVLRACAVCLRNGIDVASCRLARKMRTSETTRPILQHHSHCLRAPTCLLREDRGSLSKVYVDAFIAAKLRPHQAGHSRGRRPLHAILCLFPLDNCSCITAMQAHAAQSHCQDLLSLSLLSADLYCIPGCAGGGQPGHYICHAPLDASGRALRRLHLRLPPTSPFPTSLPDRLLSSDHPAPAPCTRPLLAATPLRAACSLPFMLLP